MGESDYVVAEGELAGLIFDCDGTLCDTMPAYFHSWTMLCEQYGLQLTEEEFYGTVVCRCTRDHFHCHPLTHVLTNN